MDTGKALTVLAACACYGLAIWAKRSGLEDIFALLSNAGSVTIGSMIAGAGLTSIGNATKIAQQTADRVVKSVFPAAPPEE